MKKIYAFLPVLLLLAKLEAQTVNPVFIGSCDNDRLSDAVLHHRYIYGIGTTYSFGASAGDIYLFKTDTLGHTIWARQIGTSDDIDEGTAIRITAGNQIVISAHIAHEEGTAMIMRFDTSGALIHSFVLNDTGCLLQDLCVKNDGGAYFCGLEVTSGHYLPEVFSTDASGNILWSKNLLSLSSTDTANGIANAVTVLNDGNLLVTGSMESGTAYLPFIVKMDAAGNIIWHKTYNMSCLDGNGNIIETQDGNYMLCGSAVRTGSSSSDPFVLKTDPSGQPIFSYVYRLDQSGGTITSFARVRLAEHENNYVLAGTAATSMTGDTSGYYALYLDAAGNIDWAKQYGNGARNICRNIISTGDFFLAGGYSNENLNGNAIVGYDQEDVQLIKIGLDGSSEVTTTDLTFNRLAFIDDTTGQSLVLNDYAYTSAAITAMINNVEGTYDSTTCFGLGVPLLVNQETGMGLFPNPAIAYTEVVLHGNISLFDLYVHDVAGELVLSRSNIPNGRTLVSVNDLSPGIYIVTARSGQQLIGSQKLVVR